MNIEELAKDYFIKSVLEKNATNLITATAA